ncbi:hypothetical protein PFMALIP_06054, partial [Plasmodium falciparum MaliPS096_E11]
MKLNYTKILLFFFPLNILANNNKNKPSITQRHTPRYTSRVLSECDIRSSIYDNDAEMKSVKETFDRQTSQRFEEYEERMKGKRQKRKEERDKNIQEIIEKDRMDKSLAEKVEKVCLRCGFGLGGVAAGVGIFGALGTYGWKIAATATAIELATKEGIKAGIDAAIAEINKRPIFQGLSKIQWLDFINESNYSTNSGIVEAVQTVVDTLSKNGETSESITRAIDRVCNGLTTKSDYFIDPVVEAGKKATALTTETVQKAQLLMVTDRSIHLYSGIGYSVIAILIIVLVM